MSSYDDSFVRKLIREHKRYRRALRSISKTPVDAYEDDASEVVVSMKSIADEALSPKGR